MNSAALGNISPSLLFVCPCGKELSEDISTQELVCKTCGHITSKEHRLTIELASKTFLETAKTLDIETILYGRADYEIDEASLPTGLLPIIISRAAHTSLNLYPDTPFLFNISEIEEPDGFITTTEYCIQVDSTSDMNVKIALMILTHITQRLVELSRLDDPSSPVINDLRTMSMTELTDGFHPA